MSAIFQTTLAQHLEFGNNLEIKAQAEQDATWFSISLLTGKMENTSNSNIDIGFYMLVSINENIIAFKECLKNKWKDLKSIEFETSQFVNCFKVNIIMDEENYHIGINNEPCIFVKYRVPLERLNVFKLNGHIQKIKQVDHRKHFPYFWPPIQISEDYIDFSNEQPIPFTPGRLVVIKAKLFGDNKGRLIIQLRNVWDITREELHMSIRFDAKKVIRNSKLPKANSEDLEYGQEENDGIFPFQVFSKPFKLAIAFTDTALRVAKDGTFICDYVYRTPNVLKDLMGVKMFGVGGVNIRVCSIDHIHLKDPQCLEFEDYSKMKYV